ncbi:Myosin-3 [Durusdinium trenchii]|uniref:Myosin-3 n=1 Tax=Durusdinium trenchii TaxID=1381693 RepID=A0ABP0P2V6_9DINO
MEQYKHVVYVGDDGLRLLPVTLLDRLPGQEHPISRLADLPPPTSSSEASEDTQSRVQLEFHGALKLASSSGSDSPDAESDRREPDEMVHCSNEGPDSWPSMTGSTATKADGSSSGTRHAESSKSSDSKSSDSEFRYQPCLPAVSSEDEKASENDRKERKEGLGLAAAWTAHAQGTCRSCRFFHLKQGGCRDGDACRFCHFCSKEQAKAELLRNKNAERRIKRRLRNT